MPARFLTASIAACLLCGWVWAVDPPAKSEATAKADDPEIDGKPLSHWINRLKAADPRVREDAAEHIHKGGPAAKKAIPLLAAMLNDPDDQARSMAGTALVGIGPDSVPVFVQALKSKNPKARWEGCNGLAGLGEFGKPGVPTLIAMLKDPDAKIRCHAAETLGSIGPEAKSAAQALTLMLRSPDADQRYSATVGLGGIGPEAKPSVGILKLLSSDPSEAVREGAAKAIAKIEAAEKG